MVNKNKSMDRKAKKATPENKLDLEISREFNEELEMAARHGNCSVGELMKDENTEQLKAWFELGYVTARNIFLKGSKMKNDLVFKATKSVTKEELRGMYSIALKREQEKDREISDLKKLNIQISNESNSLVELHERAISQLTGMDLNESTLVELVIESYKNSFLKLRPLEEILDKKTKLKYLILELCKQRRDVKILSAANGKRKKDLRLIGGQMNNFKILGLDEPYRLLIRYSGKLKKDLYSSSLVITNKIEIIRELKIEISKLHIMRPSK